MLLHLIEKLTMKGVSVKGETFEMFDTDRSYGM